MQSGRPGQRTLPRWHPNMLFRQDTANLNRDHIPGVGVPLPEPGGSNPLPIVREGQPQHLGGDREELNGIPRGGVDFRLAIAENLSNATSKSILRASTHDLPFRVRYNPPSSTAREICQQGHGAGSHYRYQRNYPPSTGTTATTLLPPGYAPAYGDSASILPTMSSRSPKAIPLTTLPFQPSHSAPLLHSHG